MSSIDPLPLQAILDPRKREYVARVTDPQLQTRMFSTILRYQQPDYLVVGDPVPALALNRLEQKGTVRFDEFIDIQPLLLLFGSFT